MIIHAYIYIYIRTLTKRVSRHSLSLSLRDEQTPPFTRAICCWILSKREKRRYSKSSKRVMALWGTERERERQRETDRERERQSHKFVILDDLQKRNQERKMSPQKREKRSSRTSSSCSMLRMPVRRASNRGVQAKRERLSSESSKISPSGPGTNGTAMPAGLRFLVLFFRNRSAFT